MGGGAPEVEITDLAYSSDRVEPGALFFCVRGFTADGHDFAPAAVRRGAAALVCERPLGLGVPEVVVPDARAAMGPAAARFFGDPTRELRVVGITGTNGKTTTAFLVRAVLERAGIAAGLLGTVTSVVGGREEPVERTTPEAIDLQRLFRRMLDSGDRGVRDGGLLARARARARGGDPLRRQRVHQPDPGPSRLPPDDGGLLRGQAAAVRRRGARRSSTSTTRGAPGWPASSGLPAPRPSRRDRRARRLPRARRPTSTPRGSRFACETPDGEVAVEMPPARPVQRAERARGDRARRRARGGGDRRRRGARAGADRVPGRFEPVDEGQDVRRARGLRAHPGLARERAARGARDWRARGCTWSSAPAATATAPSAR